MEETKLTIRLPRDLVERTKQYAHKQNTTVTKLITEYLQRIPAASAEQEHTPVVRRLSGRLSKKVSVADYKKHLEDKYGR